MNYTISRYTLVPFACALATIIVVGTGCISVKTAAVEEAPAKAVVAETVIDQTRAKNITGLATTGTSACAIVDGGVQCWGQNSYGDLGNNSTLPSTTPVKVQASATGGELKDVVEISSAGLGQHYCALLKDKTVWCWGQNTNGQLGDGTVTNRAYAVQASVTDVASVVAGYSHTCVLKTDGTAWCWGSNSSRELGDGNSVATQHTPVRIKASAAAGDYLVGIKQLLGLYGGTCALLEDTSVKCWGGGGWGQLGNMTGGAQTYPGPVFKADGVTALTGVKRLVGTYASVGAIMIDGSVWAWGCGWGQFGIGNSSGNYAYAQQMKGVGGVGTLSGIATGGNAYWQGCYISESKELYCSGGYNNARGELGYGQASSVPSGYHPVKVLDSAGASALTGVTAVAGGHAFTCAVIGSSEVKCWGTHMLGQLGTSKVPNPYLNELTPVLTDVAQVSPIGRCVTTTAGTVKCWGYNGSGALGDNTTAHSNVPVTVLDSTLATLTGVQEVAMGINAFVACTTQLDGTARCWGFGTSGQLGNGGSATLKTAVVVRDEAGTADLSNVVSVRPGFTHTCALRGGGTVSCWGARADGKLGDGSTVGTSNLPVSVRNAGNTADLTNVLDLATSINHTCAIMSNRTVQCWGKNNLGQLGDGGAVGASSALPVVVKDAAGTGTLSNVQELLAGYDNMCARVSGGSVYCWGSNSNGELGQGTLTSSSLPVQVKDSAGTGYLSGVSRIFGGSGFCAKTGGKSYCWGANSGGQLDSSSVSAVKLPTILYARPGAPVTDAEYVRLTSSTVCVLDSTGTLSCKGHMQDYLGLPDTNLSLLPVSVELQ